ncbi:MAG: S8 family serine peptidase [Thermoleophilia bacterium]|nr:S8 family serine peptidase [Thermoleophilia bacterium]MDH3724459.1 S8 family serine peptidase [Thermoleophilia bacterium]
MDAIVPAAYLWPGEWDRQLVGVEGGWQALDDAGVHPFGDPNIVIAIVDQGVKSEDGVPVHPDFRGPLSDGGDKVVALHDFHATRADNDAAQGDHGVGVAGIATAHSSLADGDQPQQGVVGAAPNCRIIGLIFPRNEVDQLDMYLWAAGFDPESDRAGFPEPLERGADVFSTSIGFGAGAPISQLASDTLAFIAREGRAGKGCPMFFSAGNAGNEFTSYRPWAAHPDTFGMGASSLDDDGQTEIRARYSGWGPVDLCAPSNDGRPMRHDPPRSYATWTCHLPGRGDLIGAPAAQTDLTETAAAGARSLGVDSADGFHEGANVMIGSPGAPGAEVSTIDEVDAGAGTITIRPALRREHPLGEPLATGERGYRSDFGGTSSATPLAAGVAALVLSANPELSIDELRELLRNTAVRIALDTDDEVGRWLDSDGNPVTESGEPAVRSQWFGHGRIDAAAAVRAVLELRAAPPPVVPPDAPGGG